MVRKIIVLFMISFYAVGCQVNNSNSGDDVKFSDGAQGIFQNRCSQCHGYGSYDNARFISEGLVVAGNPAGSPLFSRLRGSAVGGLENMPPTGDITSDEVALIRTWIEGL